MAVKVTRAKGDVPTLHDLELWFRDRGLETSVWSNEPGYVYPTHEHPYRKILFCARGSITFHTPDGDVELHAGDRMDLEPHTPHSATVGPEGVTCIEAAT